MRDVLFIKNRLSVIPELSSKLPLELWLIIGEHIAHAFEERCTFLDEEFCRRSIGTCRFHQVFTTNDGIFFNRYSISIRPISILYMGKRLICWRVVLVVDTVHDAIDGLGSFSTFYCSDLFCICNYGNVSRSVYGPVRVELIEKRGEYVSKYYNDVVNKFGNGVVNRFKDSNGGGYWLNYDNSLYLIDQFMPLIHRGLNEVISGEEDVILDRAYYLEIVIAGLLDVAGYKLEDDELLFV